MDFVWNASQASVVRTECEQALLRQAQELRDASERFIQRAIEFETEANRLAALPPPTMLVSVFLGTNSRGEGIWGTERVIDQAALDRRNQQIRVLRDRARELRRIAGNFNRAARDVEQGIAESGRLFESMHNETRQIDQIYAQRVRSVGNMRIYNYYKRYLLKKYCPDLIDYKPGSF